MYKKYFDGTCYHCGKKGHRIFDCYKWKNKEKLNQKAEKAVEEMYNLVLYIIIDEYVTKEKEIKKVSFANDTKFKKPMEAGVTCRFDGKTLLL